MSDDTAQIVIGFVIFISVFLALFFLKDIDGWSETRIETLELALDNCRASQETALRLNRLIGETAP